MNDTETSISEMKSFVKEKRQLSSSPSTKNQKKVDLGKCLVIGGSGLLGRAIVSLLESENYPVTVLDLESTQSDVKSIIGDIRNIEIVREACKGMDTVFQVAAAVWDPKRPKHVYDEVNIQGNRNVIKACIEQGVKRLIYTSTMDVVCSDEKKAYCYVDESLPYPEKMPRDDYTRTKIIGEKDVIKANGKNGLLTCSLRPVGMYGPGDKYHLGNIIKMALKGNRIKLGDGSAKFSHVFSENAAHAHILAAKHLYEGSPVVGECYFITGHQPAENLFTFMEPFLEELNLPIPNKTIPYRLAYFLAWFAEKLAPKSNFNRFSVLQACLDHTFVSDKAERDFDYKPIVSKQEAFDKTVAWFKEKLENGDFQN